MARHRSLLHQTLSELRRRHVFRVSAAYAVCAFFMVQATEIILPALHVPGWVQSLLVVLAIIGLPVVAILTWIYDISPEGIVRTDSQAAATVPKTTSNRLGWRWLDFLIIACLLGILVFVLLRGSDDATEPRPGRSIAVLPFADLSPDRDTRYFSDGMAEAIMDSLAGLPGLQVAARTSSFSFRDSDADVRRVAEELGVSTVLEGHVRRSGQRLRIGARLVDGATGRYLWNETYEGMLDDVFTVQDNISRAIVEVLQIRLLGDQDQTLVEAPTRDQEAYDYYLRGRSSLRGEASLDNTDRAIALFERALVRDPRFGLAKAGLCSAIWQKYELTREGGHAEQAIAACRRAELEDGNRAEIHVALGDVYRGTGQRELAHSAFERALKEEPGNSAAHAGLGRLLTDMRQFEAAERHLRRAIELDPAYWRHYSFLAAVFYYHGEYGKAAEQWAQAARLEPTIYQNYLNLSAALMYSGEFDRAVDASRQSIQLEPTADAYSNLGTSLFHLQEFQRAEEMYREAIALRPSDHRFYLNLAEAIDMQGGREHEVSAHYAQALALARDRLLINPGDQGAHASLARLLVLTGHSQEAQEALDILEAADLLDQFAHNELGMAYFSINEREAAIRHFAAAIERGFPPNFLKSDPRLEPLHEYPQFAELFRSHADS